jgi:hypothetical protein
VGVWAALGASTPARTNKPLHTQDPGATDGTCSQAAQAAALACRRQKRHFRRHKRHTNGTSDGASLQAKNGRSARATFRSHAIETLPTTAVV